MEVKVYSVEQINRYIRNLLENDFILNSFWVKGEISNFKAHSSGHLYFTLKDAFATIQCVMFEGAAQLLPFLPENGLSVAVCGYVSVYEKTGQYQLYAELMEPLGVGSLTLAFEQLKEKLAVEGLFDAEYKREICPYPKCVAVVTSPTGAAVRDVIRIIKRRNHTVKIVVVPVLVQGEYAPDSIVEGIKLVNQWGKADTLIVGRGGGSLEDLWAFNEEKVARAIFASEIPVISAVGHETDFTIADFVADLRASTPSAAAELSVKNLEDMTEQFQSVVSRLEYAVTNQMIQWKKRLEFIVQAKVLQQPLIQIQKQDSYIKQLQKQLEKQVYYILEKKQQKYNALKQQLDAVSPLKVLQRGYLLAKNEKGATLTTVKSIQKGENITLYFQDGTARATIIERSIQKSGKEEIDI